jgi:hypothetical protein
MMTLIHRCTPVRAICKPPRRKHLVRGRHRGKRGAGGEGPDVYGTFRSDPGGRVKIFGNRLGFCLFGFHSVQTVPPGRLETKKKRPPNAVCRYLVLLALVRCTTASQGTPAA